MLCPQGLPVIALPYAQSSADLRGRAQQCVSTHPLLVDGVVKQAKTTKRLQRSDVLISGKQNNMFFYPSQEELNNLFLTQRFGTSL